MHYLATLLIQMTSGFLILISLLLFALSFSLSSLKRLRGPLVLVVAICGVALFVPLLAFHNTPSFDFFLHTVGPSEGPQLPFSHALTFLAQLDRVRTIEDIARDPTAIPPTPSSHYVIESEEVINEVAEGIYVNSWVFNGGVPGPFLRARLNDTVTITLNNHPSSINTHSIDFHAVTGPGGGAAVLQAPPGESRVLTFKAIKPGLYVYHCATPNVGVHMTHGLYGLFLVEPEGGLPPVDKEFYIMQGEWYTNGKIGKKGLQIFDAERYLSGDPTYITFNGRTGGTVGKMTAKVGDTVRMYVGNGGVNRVSNFHVIGEMFDKVYPESGTPVRHNVQTTLIPAGGATIVEFVVDLPGKYVLVDHALATVDQGAFGILEVTGKWDDTLYSPQPR